MSRDSRKPWSAKLRAYAPVPKPPSALCQSAPSHGCNAPTIRRPSPSRRTSTTPVRTAEGMGAASYGRDQPHGIGQVREAAMRISALRAAPTTPDREDFSQSWEQPKAKGQKKLGVGV